MTQTEIVTVLRDALNTVLAMAAPFLAVSVGIGIIVAVVQAATQVHEQNVGFVFKILAIALLLVVAGSWLLAQSVDFFGHVFDAINSLG